MNKILNHVQKIWENLCKLRKSCNHNQKVNGTYKKKLHGNIFNNYWL